MTGDCLATTDDHVDGTGDFEPGHWCCLTRDHEGEHQCGACSATWDTEPERGD